MSDNEYDIRVDDLILFFRRVGPDGKEIILNRLIPHETYTADQLKVPEAQVAPAWKDAVVSEPGIKGHEDQHYYVANLARLIMPDPPAGKRKQNAVKLPTNAGRSSLASEDLVVFPPEGTDSCFRVPREVYEACPELPANDIPDLEFMASEEGVVLANVPKVTPQGCSCVLLSLVSLRSGMLGDKKHNKSEHAKRMPEAFHLGRTPHKR